VPPVEAVVNRKWVIVPADDAAALSSGGEATSIPLRAYVVISTAASNVTAVAATFEDTVEPFSDHSTWVTPVSAVSSAARAAVIVSAIELEYSRVRR
jgi:hypothetical protein